MKGGIAALAFLLCFCSCFEAKEREKTSEKAIIDWVKTNGGKVDFHIGKACPTCVRGVLANKNFAAEELIAKIPFNISVHFHPRVEIQPARRAYELLERMHSYPEFNRTFRLWWETQPSPSDVLCPEVLSEQHLSLLQSDWLPYHAKSMRAVAEEYFYGKIENMMPLLEVVPRSSVSLETFLYITALIVTRAFDFPINVEGQQHLRPFMVPAIDLLNHADPGEENSRRSNDNDFVYLYALKPVKKGEERGRDPPLLCAQDLPNFEYANPFQITPTHDADPPSVKAMAAEVKRLQGILDGLPTTMEEDLKLQEEAKNWKVESILNLRIERKRALRHRISHLGKMIHAREEL